MAEQIFDFVVRGWIPGYESGDPKGGNFLELGNSLQNRPLLKLDFKSRILSGFFYLTAPSGFPGVGLLV